MDFVVSMTHRGDELEQLLKMWYGSGDARDPFTQTIFTPLFATRGVLPFMEKFFKHRPGVIFDSGGYYVQQGVISYEELYQKLMAYYCGNNWASWYVLPDYVPTSSMSLSQVEECVNATVTVSKLFFAEMPVELRPSAIAVVQGHTLEQVRYCVENYADMGVNRLGFGSFGTSGTNNSINTITRQSIEMIEFLKQHADQHNLKLHLFGVGTPSVLSLFHNLGVDSFDSSCWSRTVGYGNVYLPFRGRRNITQGMAREIGGEAYRRADFAALKSLTGHTCLYCADIDALKQSRVRQMLHNLYVILETVEHLEQGQLLYPELVGLRATKYLGMRRKRVYRPLKLE